MLLYVGQSKEHERMIRKPTYAGKASDKDDLETEMWAFTKTDEERFWESWRLHCSNHNVPVDIRINKEKSRARKRS